MREKLTAAILVLAGVLSLASCTMPGTTATAAEDTGETVTVMEDDGSRSYSEEKVYENIDKIAADLADCN